MSNHQILGISGSLRSNSLNTALLRAARHWAQTAAEMEIHIYDDLRTIPPFDPDRNAPNPPPEVTRFREAIASADGLLIATPEYNYGITGVLKNALDWASIPTPPARKGSLARKPVAILGASPSPFGTVRAQLALRQLFLWTKSSVVTEPEVHDFDACARFDDQGEVIDETTKALVIQLLGSLKCKIQERSLLERAPGSNSFRRDNDQHEGVRGHLLDG